MLFRTWPEGDGTAVRLTERSALPSVLGAGPERWLQLRIMANPALLLTGMSSPRHAQVRSIACEVQLRTAGRADWVGLNPQGEIVLAEVKLGGNVEARREIVAQALDYYTVLRRLSYDELEAACLKGQPTALTETNTLFRASGAEDGAYGPDEFRASVERNLRTGSIHLVLALDRAPKSLVRLVTEALSDQPALPFTVSVVEIAAYDAPDGALLLAPSLRSDVSVTTRAVVRLDGPLTAALPSPTASSNGPIASSSERKAEYLSALAATEAGLPARVSAFLENASRYGVTGEVAKSMVLRLAGINAGTIDRKGVVEVYRTRPAREAGLAAFDTYQQALAAASGVPLKPGNAGEPVLRAPTARLLEREDAWLTALRNYADDMRAEAVDAEAVE